MAKGRGSQRKAQSSTDKEAAKKPMENSPKSMVIRIGAGEVGSSVSQLVQDVRLVMQPDTAIKLKVFQSCNLYKQQLLTGT
jgi:ribosome biogenesis protein SSF1/2